MNACRTYQPVLHAFGSNKVCSIIASARRRRDQPCHTVHIHIIQQMGIIHMIDASSIMSVKNFELMQKGTFYVPVPYPLIKPFCTQRLDPDSSAQKRSTTRLEH